jgi:hypothetical protein
MEQHKMQAVQKSLVFPAYHISLADVIYYQMVMSPTPIFAVATFWNNLQNLSQGGAQKQQLLEFVDRIFYRFQPTTVAPPPPKFGGSFVKTQTAMDEARDSMTKSETTDTGEQRQQAKAFHPSVQQSPLVQQLIHARQVVESLSSP